VADEEEGETMERGARVLEAARSLAACARSRPLLGALPCCAAREFSFLLCCYYCNYSSIAKAASKARLSKSLLGGEALSSSSLNV